MALTATLFSRTPHRRIEVTVPLSESSQREITVKQVKLDAIQHLRSQLYAAHNVSLSIQLSQWIPWPVGTLIDSVNEYARY